MSFRGYSLICEAEHTVFCFIDLTAERKRPLCAFYAHGGLFCIPKYLRLLFFFLLVIAFQLGSSLSPTTMTGGTCQLVGAVAPWRRILLFHSAFSRNSRLLLLPFLRYRCSVSRSPAFLRSRIPRRTVDAESLRSAAMVGMAGQHSLFSFVLSAR